MLGVIARQNARALLGFQPSFKSRQYSTVIKQDKVYELRTYSIKPEHVKDFLALTSEEFHLRTSQSKLIGYWTSELGGLNEVVHLWEYDNLEHRAKVRLNLAGNTEWIQRYFGKILPWMIGQQNSVVTAIPGIEINDAEGKGIYQLQIGNANNYAVDALKTSNLTGAFSNSLLIGAFQTIHGQLNQIALLWQHNSLTAASLMVQQQLKGTELIRLKWYKYLLSNTLSSWKLEQHKWILKNSCPTQGFSFTVICMSYLQKNLSATRVQ